jgi:hypothetical protein
MLLSGIMVQQLSERQGYARNDSYLFGSCDAIGAGIL